MGDNGFAGKDVGLVGDFETVVEGDEVGGIVVGKLVPLAVAGAEGV